MKNDFYSYLDGFNEITLIVPNSIYKDHKRFHLEAENFTTELIIYAIIPLGNEIKYQCGIDDTILLNESYVVVDEDDNRSFLRIGKVVRTELFDMMYVSDGNDYGFVYSKEKTKFKVWSPVAKEIELELVKKDGSREFIDLHYLTTGNWQAVVYEDLEGVKYRYRVRVNESFKTTTDPYAIASTANGEYNYVVDKKKFRKFKHPKPEFSGKSVDAIIYEASIRDLTSSKTSKAVNKGKFKGLLENHKNEGINYIASLGVTHIQLLPIYDFEGVDEKDQFKRYNWGYNPSQYNVVEGSFATDPDDPYKRINELIELIDYIHSKGMRVSMDVVYNHVYNVKTFSMEAFVPGYTFRYDESGMRTTISGCNNDVATERGKIHRFIVNSVKHWMETYNISAFRFDLMGLIDIETMNKVVTEAKAIDPDVLIYGEGWNMPSNIPKSHRANMTNSRFMPNIAFFNDRFRELIKGGTFNNILGYAMGGQVKRSDLYYLYTGSSLDKYLLSSPTQSLNYVECHDNHTFYDRIKLLNKDLTEEQIKDYARLAMGVVILSQGMPFIHAGQEFLRTKQGVENSYRHPDSINEIDWELRDKHQDLVNTTKDLITLRKTYKVFRLDTNARIRKQIKIVDTHAYEKTSQFILSDLNKEIRLFFKNDYVKELLTVERDYKLIFDGYKIVESTEHELYVEKPGTYIFLKE
jgi:pullulanase